MVGADECKGYKAFSYDCKLGDHTVDTLLAYITAVAQILIMLHTVAWQILVPVAMRIASLGNLEIFGGYDTTVLRSTTNSLVHAYTNAIINNRRTEHATCCLFSDYKRRRTTSEDTQGSRSYMHYTAV